MPLVRSTARPSAHADIWHRLLLDMLPLMLLALLALTTTWLVRNMPEEAITPPVLDASVPVAYMQQFQAQHFDAQGNLLAALSGQEARHLPADNSIHITAMQGYYHADGTMLRARADHASVQRGSQQADLNGHVHLMRSGQAESPIQFEGEHLRVQRQPERISSDKPVRITQDGSTVQGKGLDYRKDQQLLRIQGRVKAHIQPRP